MFTSIINNEQTSEYLYCYYNIISEDSIRVDCLWDIIGYKLITTKIEFLDDDTLKIEKFRLLFIGIGKHEDILIYREN